MDKNKIHLPNHNPSDAVWNAIENELNNQESIKSLAQYSPSDKVWRSIETQQKGSRVVIFSNWMKVAASILVILGATYFFSLLKPMSDDNSEGNITYSEIWVSPTDGESWNLEEDQNIAILIAEKESVSPYLLKSEEYQLLKEEYMNLLESKQLILNEISPYNENIELELILTRIELEKSSIVRSLIALSQA